MNKERKKEILKQYETKKINFNDLKPCYNDRYEGVLLPFVELILKQGYKVWTNAKLQDCSYFLISNGYRLVYLQKEYFSGISISTKHKNNSKTGGGHQIIAEEINPNLEHLNNVFRCTFKGETYFKDLEDYVKNNTYKIYTLNDYYEVQ